MTLAYKKVTKEQDGMRNIFEKGKYPFSVKSITEKLCKNKINKMLIVELLVIDQRKTLTITDWIMLDIEGMEWKLRHFCDSLGLSENYDNDKLTINDFHNKSGIAKLTIGEYERDGEIIKVNRVADYVTDKKLQVNINKDQKAEDFFDDKIQF